MQHVNEPFLRLFGYRKGELEGSNVARIMPNPFSAQHDSERLARLLGCCCWESVCSRVRQPCVTTGMADDPHLPFPVQVICATMPPRACRASWTPPARWWRCTSSATCLESTCA